MTDIPEPCAGQVWKINGQHVRVVTVVIKHDGMFYDLRYRRPSGGLTDYLCLRVTWNRWAKKTGARP